MRTTRMAGYAILFTLVTAVLAYGDSASKDAGALPTSPRRVTPLLIGEAIPAAALKTPAGETYIREVKDEVMFQCCFGLDFR